jgi:2-polyprenyl-6-methoxyphenol hydroxylase-like FAD-dependent oxidoreductase
MPQVRDERPDALVLDVLVVGAGQAGVATGYFLPRAGVRFLLLDGSAHVGDSWRRRYDSLALFSPRSFSALPGLVVPGDPNGYPTKDEIANYHAQDPRGVYGRAGTITRASPAALAAKLASPSRAVKVRHV